MLDELETEEANAKMIEDISYGLAARPDYVPLVHRIVCEEGISLYTDMVEALQQAEMAMLGYTHRNSIIEAALKTTREALAKATGKE